MDIEKLLKLAVEYLSDYLATFVATLQRPGLRFRPVIEATAATGIEKSQIASLAGVTARGAQLNPRLFSFVLLSIFIGSTLNALIPGRRASPDFSTTVVVVLATWFFYSALIHGLTRLVDKRGLFWETISVSLQVFAVLYVVSSFAALLWAALTSPPQVRSILFSLDWLTLNTLSRQPVLMYFLVHFILLAIYLPMALKYVHQLNRIEQFLIGMFAVVIALIGYTIYPVFGLVIQPQTP